MPEEEAPVVLHSQFCPICDREFKDKKKIFALGKVKEHMLKHDHQLPSSADILGDDE